MDLIEKGGFIVKNKKVLVTCGVLLIIGLIIALISLFFINAEKNVKFEVVKSDKIPEQIKSEIIPEYKKLERALAYVEDDKVYVIVSRGEKPSTGYNVDVNKIVLEEKDGIETIIVYADFKDPAKKTSISQIITYPVAVVKTELKNLPDSIELRIQY